MGNLLKKALEFISTSSHSRTVSIIVILVIAAAIPLTVITSQKQQEIRQRAADIIPTPPIVPVGGNCGAFGCDGPNLRVDWERNSLAYYGYTVRLYKAGTSTPACLGITNPCTGSGQTVNTSFTFTGLSPGSYYDLYVFVSASPSNIFWKYYAKLGPTGACTGGFCSSPPTPTPIPTSRPTPTPIPTQGAKECFGGCYGLTSCVGCDRYNTNCNTTTGACTAQGSLNKANDPTCGTSCAPQTPTSTPTPIPWSLSAPVVSGSNVTFNFSPASNGNVGIHVIFNPDTGIAAWDSGPIPSGRTSIAWNGAPPGNYSSALVFATTTLAGPRNFTVSGTNPTLTPTPRVNPTPTTPPGVTATPTPTRTVTPTPTPTPTIPAGNTVFALTIGLDGLGSTGDNANPGNSSGSNKNPKRPSRNIKIEVFVGSGESKANKSGTLTYQTGSGKFTGNVDMGTLASGNYNVKVKSDGYLKRLVPGIQNVTFPSETIGRTYNVPAVNLVAGDINGDNAINILDYNILISCSVFSTDNHGACNGASIANSQYAVLSDLDDNGAVNQFDYNLFIRELSVQNGE